MVSVLYIFVNLVSVWTKINITVWFLTEYTEAFLKFDADDSGTIDVRELMIMLESMGRNLSPGDVLEMIAEYDEDGYVHLFSFCLPFQAQIMILRHIFRLYTSYLIFVLLVNTIIKLVKLF